MLLWRSDDQPVLSAGHTCGPWRDGSAGRNELPAPDTQHYVSQTPTQQKRDGLTRDHEVKCIYI